MSKLLDIKHKELAPCPRCNSMSVIQQRWVKGHANLIHYKPVCSACSFSYRDEYKSINKAINIWNNLVLKEV